MGANTTAAPQCIALGDAATAIVPATGNPVLNLSPAVAVGMTTGVNAHVFTSNGAALTAGLNPGDIYVLDPTTVGLPAIGPGPLGGPAILAVVYP